MSDPTATAGYTLFPTAIGTCAIAWRGTCVVATSLPEPSEVDTAARIIRKTGGAEADAPPDFVQAAIAAIQALLDGAQADLNFIACDYGSADPFRIQIYDLTRAIPPGDTVTYGDIALKLGNKRFAQAVGQAMGSNPLPIVVPCHRVMGAGGKLTGFSANGGVGTKLRMLEIERAAIGGQPGLFDTLPLATRP